MMVIRQGFISRADVKHNPTLLYIFGDNLARAGLGGQAKEMRGEDNAYGLVTKRRPSHGHPDDYFHDYQEDCIALFDADFKWLLVKLRSGAYQAVVIPLDGIGTGLAQLQHHAPGLLRHINNRLKELESLNVHA